MDKPTRAQSKTTNTSIRDVARRAGVSIASVSRALNEGSGNVSNKTRDRVIKAAEELNYSPNHIGRSLRAQTTNTYALILSNIQNNFFAAVAWELERLLSQSGRAMLLYTSNEDPDIQDRCLEDIRARQVSGVFFLCATNSPRLQDFVTSGPVVFINRRIASLPDVSFVGIDDRAAARELMETMLRRQGSASFGLIHGPLSSDTSSRRLEGMLAACKEAGMEISSNDIREANLSMEGGYEAACSLLADKPLATLFCGNDQIGYGAYRRCRELGLRVPDDIAIYGFDDNPLNEWLAPWLNTVRVPHLSFAKTAIDQMQRLVDGHDSESLTIPYQVILRS